MATDPLVQIRCEPFNDQLHPNCRCMTLPVLHEGDSGMKRISSFDFTCGESVAAKMKQHLFNGRPIDVKFAGVYDGDALVAAVVMMDSISFDHRYRVTLAPTGRPVSLLGVAASFYDRSAPDRAELQKEKTVHPKTMRKGLKGFYVGSNTVSPEWTKATEAEAVKQAEELVASGQQEEAFVVRIVKVVRRKPQPIVAEPFKAVKR